MLLLKLASRSLASLNGHIRHESDHSPFQRLPFKRRAVVDSVMQDRFYHIRLFEHSL